MPVPTKLPHKETLDVKSSKDVCLTTPKTLHGNSRSVLFQGQGCCFQRTAKAVPLWGRGRRGGNTLKLFPEGMKQTRVLGQRQRGMNAVSPKRNRPRNHKIRVHAFLFPLLASYSGQKQRAGVNRWSIRGCFSVLLSVFPEHLLPGLARPQGEHRYSGQQPAGNTGGHKLNWQSGQTQVSLSKAQGDREMVLKKMIPGAPPPVFPPRTPTESPQTGSPRIKKKPPSPCQYLSLNSTHSPTCKPSQASCAILHNSKVHVHPFLLCPEFNFSRWSCSVM